MTHLQELLLLLHHLFIWNTQDSHFQYFLSVYESLPAAARKHAEKRVFHSQEVKTNIHKRIRMK